jgi:ElaA protein
VTAGAITATGDQLDAATLYAILRLRAEVFVVEQSSPYLDPDGRDLEPETLHCWASGIVAYLRVVTEGDARRIGRVVTARSARGQGHAGTLVRLALDRFGHQPLVLDAQTRLAGWYQRFGFAPDGAEFVEDGISHVPMRRIP